MNLKKGWRVTPETCLEWLQQAGGRLRDPDDLSAIVDRLNYLIWEAYENYGTALDVADMNRSGKDDEALKAKRATVPVKEAKRQAQALQRLRERLDVLRLQVAGMPAEASAQLLLLMEWAADILKNPPSLPTVGNVHRSLVIGIGRLCTAYFANEEPGRRPKLTCTAGRHTGVVPRFIAAVFLDINLGMSEATIVSHLRS